MQTIPEVLVSQGVLASQIEQFCIISLALSRAGLTPGRRGVHTFVDVDNLSTQLDVRHDHSELCIVMYRYEFETKMQKHNGDLVLVDGCRGM